MARFINAPTDTRCTYDITRRDGSKAQCGRRRATGDYCTQHARIVDPSSSHYTSTRYADEMPESDFYGEG